MDSFLKAEWKTIVGILLFGGALFGWFYGQELRKAASASAPYAYTCLRAGEGLFDMRLGAPMEALDLTGYAVEKDDALDVAHAQSADQQTTLHFRQGRLASIEYRPSRDTMPEACGKDWDMFKKTKTQVAESIQTDGISYAPYEGITLVNQILPPKGAPEENEGTPEGAARMKRLGWIIGPI